MKLLETLWENLNLITYVIMTELLSIGSLLHLLGSIMPCITATWCGKDYTFSKDAIDTSLTAYNNACANMRSEARDNLISIYIDDGEEAKLYL